MTDAAPPDLDALVPLIAVGDEEAFARFVAASEQTVRRSLRSFATMLDTEALVQEAFLRVWQSAARFVPDGREGSFLRFAVRVARNLAVSELRRRREVLVESVVDEPAPQAATVDPLLRSVISRCLEALLGPARVALFARIESAGHDADAVLAERVGMRPNTFLQNITRARRSLVTCLESQGVRLQEGA
jgi:RNA polymerase sigma factor (sigma-70 family)